MKPARRKPIAPPTPLWAVSLLLFLLAGPARADEWRQLATGGTAPSPRTGHSAVFLGSKIYVFGGQPAGSGQAIRMEGLLNDLFCFSINDASWELEAPMTQPPARKNLGMVDGQGSLYILYGEGETTPYNDVWKYVIDTNSWSQETVLGERPSARGGMSVLLDQAKLYLFGGQNRYGQVQSDVWSFSSGVWTREPVSTLPASGQSAAAVDGKIYLFGGHDGSGGLYDFLNTFDPSTKQWERPAVSGDAPPARRDALLLPAGETLVLTGGQGYADGGLNDVWEFDLGSNRWVRRMDAPIVPLGAAVVLPDRRAAGEAAGQDAVPPGAVVLCGVIRDGAVRNETWLYLPESVSPTVPGDVNHDQAVTAQDLELLGRWLAGSPTGRIETRAADLDGDGRIDGVDFVLLARRLQ